MKKGLLKKILIGVLISFSLVGCQSRCIEPKTEPVIENTTEEEELDDYNIEEQEQVEQEPVEQEPMEQEPAEQEPIEQEIKNDTPDTEENIDEIVMNENSDLNGDYRDVSWIEQFDNYLQYSCELYAPAGGTCTVSRENENVYFSLTVPEANGGYIYLVEELYNHVINGCIDLEVQMGDCCIEVYHGGGLFISYENGELIYLSR